MVNRSREEIIASMLECVSAPIPQTSIMYRANLSYTQLRSYLRFLLERNLITTRDGMWVATERGREYLAAYMSIKKIFEEGSAVVQAIPRR